MPNLISPSFQSEKLENPSTDDLIDVFEDRIIGWLLDPARKLLPTFNDLPASLCLQMTYFEGIWSYIVGESSEGQSKDFFKYGFLSVFHGFQFSDELLLKTADVLYKDARCGFFHDGILRDRIFFGNQGPALMLTLPKHNGIIDLSCEIESIMIDPKQFLSTIEKHFTVFIGNIRDSRNSEKRSLFEKAFKIHQGRPRVIGIPEPTIS